MSEFKPGVQFTPEDPLTQFLDARRSFIDSGKWGDNKGNDIPITEVVIVVDIPPYATVRPDVNSADDPYGLNQTK